MTDALIDMIKGHDVYLADLSDAASALELIDEWRDEYDDVPVHEAFDALSSWEIGRLQAANLRFGLT